MKNENEQCKALMTVSTQKCLFKVRPQLISICLEFSVRRSNSLRIFYGPLAESQQRFY